MLEGDANAGTRPAGPCVTPMAPDSRFDARGQVPKWWFPPDHHPATRYTGGCGLTSHLSHRQDKLAPHSARTLLRAVGRPLGGHVAPPSGWGFWL